MEYLPADNRFNFSEIISVFLFFLLAFNFLGCRSVDQQSAAVMPKLTVSDDHRYLVDSTGMPFCWIGGTVWGITEWLSREEINYYLDDRKSKGFNVIQFCLFWGKRSDDPVNFTMNPRNFYGYSAFEDFTENKTSLTPATKPGGSPEGSNDYWDHVDYIMAALKKRDMMAAVLPVWGRRYVNATHNGFSAQLFSPEEMYAYGQFLGNRYRSNDHIIWVLGGDVQADFGGDFLGHYRSMAEGIIFGITGQNIAWNENSPYWNYALMTYHPDGSPMKNSSTWFHDDAWLDFNMIETFVNVNSVYEAVTQDYTLSDPIKPTVMGEPAYENHPGKEGPIAAIQVRRQGWQSFFAGAAGFTYGAFRDSLGNGPLFSPFNHWEKTLNWEGAKSLAFLKSFCLENNWPHWKPNQKILGEGQKEGEYLKTAVQLSDHYYLIYFPDRSTQMLIFNSGFSEVFGSWYNPKNGLNQNLDPITLVDGVCKIIPPDAWSDAVAVIHLK